VAQMSMIHADVVLLVACQGYTGETSCYCNRLNSELRAGLRPTSEDCLPAPCPEPLHRELVSRARTCPYLTQAMLLIQCPKGSPIT
jgi:hypothetical protein